MKQSHLRFPHIAYCVYASQGLSLQTRGRFLRNLSRSGLIAPDPRGKLVVTDKARRLGAAALQLGWQTARRKKSR